MDGTTHWRLGWARPEGAIEAIEPSFAELAASAPDLAVFYNEPRNRGLLGHTSDLGAADVEAHYRRVWGGRGRPFLLHRQGGLVGDADLRNVGAGFAEFAILIGSRAEQGRGLGTRFATLIHAFAFEAMDLRRLYVSILPTNPGSRRLFEKLGYAPDSSAEARAYADDAEDLTFSMDREVFLSRHSGVRSEMWWENR